MAKLSTKNQITIPVNALREAGIEPGEDLQVRVVGHGRIEVASRRERFSRFAGALPRGTYPVGYLDEVRGEWRS